jgi:hypothetical protein
VLQQTEIWLQSAVISNVSSGTSVPPFGVFGYVTQPYAYAYALCCVVAAMMNVSDKGHLQHASQLWCIHQQRYS